MKGYLLKDWYQFLKYYKYMVLMVLVFTGVSAFSENSWFFAFYPAVMMSLMPVTFISYDEKTGFCGYSAALPASRKTYVTAKYLLGLIGAGGVLLIFLLFHGVRAVVTAPAAAALLLTTAGLILSAGLISSGLMLPFTFRYGADKGRIAYVVVIGAACAAFAVYGLTMGDRGFSAAGWVPLLVLPAAILLYAASWLISVKVYENREL